MGERSSSRRAFLGGIVGVGASAAVSKTASAQSALQINNPNVVREIDELFARYDDALRNNDVAALNGFFFDSPTTVRFGARENLYGISEIEAFRASRSTAPNVVRERTVITTYGTDVATVAAAGGAGRTMQTWVRFPQGWRIVAAHVSRIDE
jgi:hypothetical protein